METASDIRGRCSRHPADRTRSSEQFVVQANHKRAELTDGHEVAAQDVDPARLAARTLLAGPAEQQRESPHRHLPHVKQGVEEDVRNVFCQVQTADVETSWETVSKDELKHDGKQ